MVLDFNVKCDCGENSAHNIQIGHGEHGDSDDMDELEAIQSYAVYCNRCEKEMFVRFYDDFAIRINNNMDDVSAEPIEFKCRPFIKGTDDKIIKVTALKRVPLIVDGEYKSYSVEIKMEDDGWEKWVDVKNAGRIYINSGIYTGFPYSLNQYHRTIYRKLIKDIGFDHLFHTACSVISRDPITAPATFNALYKVDKAFNNIPMKDVEAIHDWLCEDLARIGIRMISKSCTCSLIKNVMRMVALDYEKNK